ncbi:MAG: hypothetical protein AB7O52_16645 [Planctomycetota bacterium]
MDIRYCDQCGDIIQGGAPASLGSKVLCTSCSGSKAAAQPLTARPSSQRTKTEEMRPPVDEIPQFTLSSVMRDDGLDLFSPDTIALRKQQRPPKGASKLKLLDESQDEAKSAPMHTGSVHVGQARPSAAAAPAADPVSQRWTVHCGHCQAQLSIKPVSQRSRMRCPRCGGQQILDPAGTLQPIVAPQAAPQQQQVAQFDLGAAAPAARPPQGPSTQQYAHPASAGHPGAFGMNLEQTIQISARAPSPDAEPTMNIAARRAPPSFADEGLYEEDSPTAIVAKLAGMVRGLDAPARPPQAPAGPLTATRPGGPVAAQDPSPSPRSKVAAPASATATVGDEHGFLTSSPVHAQPHAPAAQVHRGPAHPGPAVTPRSFPVLESESYTFEPHELGQSHDGPGIFAPRQETAASSAPADWGVREPEPQADFRASHAALAATAGLQAEAVVLWIMIASLPTFAGMFLVSTAAGPEAQALIKTCGESARAGLEWFFGLFK